MDKPPGPTSFDVVRRLKRIFPGAKIGHTGSLDPFASGVLILLFGKATKLSNILLNADKKYHGVLRLGEATDTMDSTGEVNDRKPIPESLVEGDVTKTMSSFEGEWEQTPPMYSAKKFHGVRLYELARQNIRVPRKKNRVQLYQLSLIRFQTPEIEFETHCSKGTYVRVLAHELGLALGSCAHLRELRRTASGPFSLADSVTLEVLEENPAHWMEQGYRNYVTFLRTEQQITRRGGDLPLQQRGGNSFVR